MTRTCAVVIVTYNSGRKIDDLLWSLDGATALPLRIICVDNGSSDDTLERLAAWGDVDVVQLADNPGYAAGVNRGRDMAEGAELVLVLNPDVVVEPSAVDAMVATLDAEVGVGAVVPRIEDAHGVLSPSLRREPTVGRLLGDALLGAHLRQRGARWGEVVYDRSAYDRVHDIDWATGAAILIDSKCFDDVGPWDERFFLYSEEIDFCRRLRASGRRLRFCPTAVVRHEGGGSGSSVDLDVLLQINRVRYAKKHHGPVVAAATWLGVILNNVLRPFRPGARARLRVLTNPESWPGFVARLRGVPAAASASWMCLRG